ncbi:MAG: GGDEF domain-containing protein [Proteobacteria bacterium]|nr:GGDEF domain-containing protein [Pseudomonadota bacterium]
MQARALGIARGILYPLIGVLLGLGAPLGLLLLRAAAARSWPGVGWARQQLDQDPLTYAYLASATPIVFAVVGAMLGRLEDRLTLQARTDRLTGLANRALFEERLAYELSRRQRYPFPLALLIVDVDGLKRINDTGGHKAGDVALRSVGQSLKTCSRSADLPARLAGDEFAVLAPSTRAADAMKLAQRIRSSLAEQSDVTVSIGIADTEDLPQPGSKALMEAADKALYEAKTRGRDRAVSSLPPRPDRADSNHQN